MPKAADSKKSSNKKPDKKPDKKAAAKAVAKPTAKPAPTKAAKNAPVKAAAKLAPKPAPPTPKLAAKALPDNGEHSAQAEKMRALYEKLHGLADQRSNIPG